MDTNGLPEMQGFETRRHRGHGEVGKKQREGIERGEKIQKVVPQAGLDSRGLGKGSCKKLCELCASVF